MGRDHGYDCHVCGLYVGGMNDPDELGHAEECSERPAPSDLRERAVKALREVDRALGDERATVGTVSDALKPLRAAIAAMKEEMVPLTDAMGIAINQGVVEGREET